MGAAVKLRFISFLCANKDSIGAGAAIVGVFVGLAGFTLTIWQLNQANRTLEAANAYEIQKYAQKIINAVRDNRDFREAMSGEERNDERLNAFRDEMWLLLNFHLSVYRQYRT